MGVVDFQFFCSPDVGTGERDLFCSSLVPVVDGVQIRLPVPLTEEQAIKRSKDRRLEEDRQSSTKKVAQGNRSFHSQLKVS